MISRLDAQACQLPPKKGEKDGGIKCAVHAGLRGCWNFTDDWIGFICIHSFNSLLCCFLPECQGNFLISLVSIPGKQVVSWKFNKDSTFLSSVNVQFLCINELCTLS
ncbi:Hypothetical predicted protein [Olea europaea subsp. europaea]|uniref:Uncharacterized protein n=1 Tax=Olea europaea subsp. europaea TaxID=158383 RepID=A0A8S0REK5_OLEEU|nr:Hypothetical predicted protein [Olea europaea subsp. europaea]